MLAEPLFWGAAALAIIAQFLVLKASLAAMRNAGSPAQHTSSRGSEIMWAVIPAAVLILLIAVTWRAVT